MAELLAAFSLATDLGLGQPMEHVLRSWLISKRLGDYIGLEPEDRGDLYYVATLAWVGCVADTPDLATWFGDDIAFRRDSRGIDLAGLPMLGFMLRHVGAGSPAMHRFRLAVNLVVTGGKGVERVLMSQCLTTARMAGVSRPRPGGVRPAPAGVHPLGRKWRPGRCQRRADQPSHAAVPSRRRGRGVPSHRGSAKTGASTRSTATLFAVQHGLLDSLQPLDL